MFTIKLYNYIRVCLFLLHNLLSFYIIIIIIQQSHCLLTCCLHIFKCMQCIHGKQNCPPQPSPSYSPTIVSLSLSLSVLSKFSAIVILCYIHFSHFIIILTDDVGDDGDRKFKMMKMNE